jgi:FtsH-binding integral membrane protein
VDITATSLALGVCLAALAIAVFLDRRPYRPGKRNYVLLMIVALAAALVLGRHLLTLVF